MKTFNITDYGAAVSDRLQTAAIQKAIDECFLSGGGEVIVPAGIFRTGGLRLRSNVVLHLLSGAVLEGSVNPDDYTDWREDRLEPVAGIPEAEPEKNRSALRTSRWNNAMIRAIDAHDIGVIGEENSYINGMNCYDPAGEERYRGPHGIDIWDSERVTLRGYTLRNIGNWGHAIFRTKDIDVRNVKVQGGHDGIDVFLCERVRIEDCEFLTGDDCLAGFGSRDVEMRRCVLNSSCSSIRFGGTDVVIEDCVNLREPEFDFRGMLSGEEKSRRMYSSRTCARRVKNAFLYYCDGRFGKLPFRAGNIVIRNCRFEFTESLFKMPFGEHIWCNGDPLRSIIFENCEISGVSRPMYIHGSAEAPVDFRLKNVRISREAGHESGALIEAENFAFLGLENVEASGNLRVVTRSDGEVSADCGVEVIRGERKG